MEISVKGKQLDVGAALRTHVEASLGQLIAKYFADPIEAQVTLAKDAGHYHAEILVQPKRGIKLAASANANEPYPAFDDAAAKIAKRLQRYKSRLNDMHSPSTALHDEGGVSVRKTVLNVEPPASTEAAAEHIVIAEMTTQILTLTVSEAVMRLELQDLPALLFNNKNGKGLNMIYRRPDGNIGWVDPSIAQ